MRVNDIAKCVRDETTKLGDISSEMAQVNID